MYRIGQHTQGMPLPTWKMPRSFVKFIAKLPSAEVLHETIEKKSFDDDRFTAREELAGRVRVSSFNDGAGNGFDVVSCDNGSIFLGLDHEIHDETVVAEDISRIIPDDLHKLVHYALFSCVEDDCPVGVVMWRRLDEDKWHVGFAQDDVSLFRVILED